MKNGPWRHSDTTLMWPLNRKINKTARTMPVRSAGKNPIASLSYDASVVESETRMPGSENFLELACRVVTLRLERGYLVKIYDVSSAELTKPLRRQLRENYDVKKVRNTDYGISLSLISN